MYSGKKKILKAVFLILLMIFSSVWITGVYAAEKKDSAEKPVATGDTFTLGIEFTGRKPDMKIAKASDREVMVAFKMKAESDDFRMGSGKQNFEGIRFERLPGGAQAIFLKTRDIIGGYEASWAKDGKNLEITVKTVKEEPKKQAEKLPAPAEETKKSEDVEFINNLKGMTCLDDGTLSSAFRAVSDENWESALEIIDEYLADVKNEGKCADAATFLKAYVFYRSKGENDPATSRRMFQEAMLKFPDSPYVPYSALYLGELELSQTGYAPAAGYFNYILTEFPDFRAKPQAIFGSAISNINLDNLISAYKGLNELYTSYPDSVYTEHAALQQGKIFFKRGDYAEALKRFEVYLAKNKDKIYESPELLYYLGSSAYQSGDYKKAIDYLSRAYNLFPDIKEPDILFSRIAESFLEEGQLQKAKKIYELVRAKYEGTDGFAVSSVRLAGLTENPEERDGIYQEVVDGFPENPLAKLSMLKLASARYDSGDYEKSIDLLERLLSDKPGVVKKEGDALLFKSIEKFFLSKTGEGKYFDAVKTYEAKKKLIDNYINPKIEYLVGKSYLRMGLYEPAYEHLSAADKGFGKNKLPGFNYDFAVALDETGRTAEAKQMLLEASSTDFQSSVDSLKRLAQIQIGEGKLDEALNTYRDAFSRSETPEEKAGILLEQSDIFEKNKDNAGVISILSKADELLGVKKQASDRDTLLKILKKLGETKAKEGDLIGASADFERALSMKKEGEDTDELSFLLADTYERMKKTSEASEIFTKISEGENEFWSKLAKERLEQLAFFEKIRSSEKKLAAQSNG